MSKEYSRLLDTLLDGQSLTEAQARDLMYRLSEGELPSALAGALLAGLRAKGETADEIRGFATAMRELAVHPEIPVGAPTVDTVGTGGDGSGSLNLSTGTGLLAAACGSRVAPAYHPAMKAVVPIRGALAVRTVFNVLGPLTNPAAPPFQLIGAYSEAAARLMADTLAGMPLERAFVVHGEPGWDEATPAGDFVLFDVRPGSVTESRRSPGDYGLDTCAPEALEGGDAEHNARELVRVFTGEDRGAHRDALLMGVSLVLEVQGLAKDAKDGVAQAAAAIDDGRAAAFLENLRGHFEQA